MYRTKQIFDLQTIETERILPFFNNIIHYKSSSISVESVFTEQVVPLSRFVVKSRLIFAISLLRSYLALGIKLYMPVLLPLGCKFRILVPPVVEVHNNHFYLVDGMHRLYVLIRERIHTVHVCVVRHVPYPLPAKPINWLQVEEVSITKPLLNNITNLKVELFRPVTKLLNSPLTIVKKEKTI